MSKFAFRWDRVLEAGVTVSSLMRATDGHPHRSLLWRDVQSQLGVSDTAIVVFADRHGCWGVLDLWRYGGASFQADELRLLATLARPVTAALRAAIARTFTDPGRQLHPVGPAVVVLDPGLQVRSQTDAAADALLRLNPPDEPMAPIPADWAPDNGTPNAQLSPAVRIDTAPRGVRGVPPPCGAPYRSGQRVAGP